MLIKGISSNGRSFAEKLADDRFAAAKQRRKFSKYELDRSNIAQHNGQFS
jgi:hypothetical protein